MKKLRVYLDTSVVSARFDGDKPERQEQTRQFFARCDEFEVFISSLTMREIENTPDQELRGKMLALAKPFALVPDSDEVRSLAESYLRLGVLPPGKFADLLHIAYATVAGLGYLLSWNFTHLVKIKTKAKVNMANIANNYAAIEIVPPPEVC